MRKSRAGRRSGRTASRTSRVSEEVQTETVSVIYELQYSPTQSTPGSVTYTSGAFTNRAFAVQRKTENIPPLGTMQVLSLPGNLTSIEEEAFMGGAFEAVIVPAGCTAIGNRAFADCTSLKYIRIPGANTTVSDTAFAGCGMVIVDRTSMS